MVHPQAVDSPAVLHSLVVFTAAIDAWLRWDTTPTQGLCPTMDLMVRVLERTSVMTLGAMVLPDPAFLDRPLEVTPAGLAMEMESLRRELRALTPHLVAWRKEAPGHLGAAMDRLTLAVIQACAEMSYFETFPVVTVVSENLERLNAAVTDLHLRIPPWTCTPRVQVTPSAGSDRAPMPTISAARVHEEITRLQAIALRDDMDDATGENTTS